MKQCWRIGCSHHCTNCWELFFNQNHIVAEASLARNMKGTVFNAGEGADVFIVFTHGLPNQFQRLGLGLPNQSKKSLLPLYIWFPRSWFWNETKDQTMYWNFKYGGGLPQTMIDSDGCVMPWLSVGLPVVVPEGSSQCVVNRDAAFSQSCQWWGSCLIKMGPTPKLRRCELANCPLTISIWVCSWLSSQGFWQFRRHFYCVQRSAPHSGPRSAFGVSRFFWGRVISCDQESVFLVFLGDTLHVFILQRE